MIGELDSEVMNHAALVLCIQVPMFDISDAIHMARKAACRNGAQADLVFGAGEVSAAPARHRRADWPPHFLPPSRSVG
jgi:hypothetical protein